MSKGGAAGQGEEEEQKKEIGEEEEEKEDGVKEDKDEKEDYKKEEKEAEATCNQRRAAPPSAHPLTSLLRTCKVVLQR